MASGLLKFVMAKLKLICMCNLKKNSFLEFLKCHLQLITSKEVFHKNQKYVGMAVVNKVHRKILEVSITAPYIVTHNHPYISSCKSEIPTRATYLRIKCVMESHHTYSCT